MRKLNLSWMLLNAGSVIRIGFKFHAIEHLRVMFRLHAGDECS